MDKAVTPAEARVPQKTRELILQRWMELGGDEEAWGVLDEETKHVKGGPRAENAKRRRRREATKVLTGKWRRGQLSVQQGRKNQIIETARLKYWNQVKSQASPAVQRASRGDPIVAQDLSDALDARASALWDNWEQQVRNTKPGNQIPSPPDVADMMDTYVRALGVEDEDAGPMSPADVVERQGEIERLETERQGGKGPEQIRREEEIAAGREVIRKDVREGAGLGTEKKLTPKQEGARRNAIAEEMARLKKERPEASDEELKAEAARNAKEKGFKEEAEEAAGLRSGLPRASDAYEYLINDPDKVETATPEILGAAMASPEAFAEDMDPWLDTIRTKDAAFKQKVLAAWERRREQDNLPASEEDRAAFWRSLFVGG